MSNQQSKNDLQFNLMEEQANVSKQVVENARVRIVKEVNEEHHEVDLSARTEEVEVHKVVINKYVDKAPEVRYEGDTIIVPVMKEVVVVEKRLLLAEEIHITKQVVTKNERQSVPLLREELHVERISSNKI